MATAALPLIKATESGKAMVRLLADVGRELAQELTQAITCYSRCPKAALADRQKFAEIHYLRLEQLRRVEKIITPDVSIKRHYVDKTLISLKIKWKNEKGGSNWKTVPTFFDYELSKSVIAGDSLAQILYTAQVGTRTFSFTPTLHKKGMVPCWIYEWELTKYSLKYLPKDFSEWVEVRID